MDARWNVSPEGAWYELSNLRAACIPCNTSQRNSRVAARARAQRDAGAPSRDWSGTSRNWCGTTKRTDLTW